ncbi:hypothetical protein [Streptomyces avermitilis]
MPAEPMLRELERLLKPALASLVAEYGLTPAGSPWMLWTIT